MRRVNKILNHHFYIDNLKKNSEAEKNREFCMHNLQHFLDVARIGYIIALERNISVEKEVIYVAALLHDIGRWKQYLDGTDHAAASAELAKDILRDCEFEENEMVLILEAIRKHRNGENLTTELDYILYESDKICRLCIQCESINECKRFTNKEKPKLIL